MAGSGWVGGDDGETGRAGGAGGSVAQAEPSLPDAQPEPMQDAHQGRVVLDLRGEALDPEDDPEPGFALRAADVLHRLDEDQPRLDFEVAVVPVHRAEQGPEVVGAHADAADSEGDVLGGDPAGDRAVEVGNAVYRRRDGLGHRQQHRHPPGRR